MCAVEIFFLEMLICQANVFIQNIANLKLAMTPIANFQEEAICIYSFKVDINVKIACFQHSRGDKQSALRLIREQKTALSKFQMYLVIMLAVSHY